MGILRKIRKENFTTVCNEYLQDNSLSWKAKGMITYLMSLPDDWKVNVGDLTNRSKDGRDSVMSTLKEIEDNQYGRKIKNRNKKGRFDNFDFEVSDFKAFKPILEKPILEKPILEKPTLLNTNNSKDLILPNTKNSDLPENNSGSLFPEEKNSEIPYHFRNSLFVDEGGEELFISMFKKELAIGIDVKYYYNCVKDWSETKTQKSFKRTARGWLATARTFMRRDEEQGKLKMQIKYQNASKGITDNDMLDYLNGYE